MINVMIVSRQEAAIRALRHFISEDPELEVSADSRGGESALEKVETVAPDVLIIWADENDPDAINLAERIILRKPRTFVILLVPELSIDIYTAAANAGCHNVFPYPDEGKELTDLIHRVYNAESGRLSALTTNQRVTWTSRVLTVFGAKGGLGKTTMSVNLAMKLASMKKKVAIVDLDLQFGDVHIFMDMDPKDTISDLMQDMANPTIDTIRSYMTVHPSGVHVLCAPKSPEYADLVSAEKLQTVLGLLRSYYDFVIIDTAANFTDPIITALEASTTILFLTGLDVSILKNSKVAMSILESLGQKKKVRAVINRAVEINSITIADVQRIVDAPILSRIPSDYMMAVAALNRGQPFVQSAPRSKLSLAVSDMAEKLAEGKDNFDMQQLSARERKAMMRKYRTRDASEKKGLFGRR